MGIAVTSLQRKCLNLVDDRSGQPEETTIERCNPLNSEVPEWLQEFREILVDDEIPLQGGLSRQFFS